MTAEAAELSNIALDDPVDEEIAAYLDLASPRSFFLFAGAGSGKTRSLVKALNHVKATYGRDLSLRGHRVGVISYTNAACEEIKRRVDFSPLFYVATIHSFAWELIKGFHHDIREWLHQTLVADIEELKVQEEKGRAGTKASITRLAQMESKSKRLDRLGEIKSFAYNPNGENREPNSLNHSEVIAICSAFIAQKPLMRWILVGRFPFLLIDESQDTNRHLVDALFVPAQEHSDRFSLGLIGDVMQRIYADGKERIEEELPKEWAKPSKKLNHRCPKRVVTLINKIRSEVDTHEQDARSDAIEGHVRLFIRPSGAPDRRAVEDEIRADMAAVTEDAAWDEINNCKVLTLEHHMSAKRLGFANVFTPLYEIDSWRTGLLDGTLPATRFFTQSVLPLIEASRRGDKFAVSRIVRQFSPLVTAPALKAAEDAGALLKQAQSGVDALMALWEDGDPICGDVLCSIAEHQIFVIPDILLPVVEVLQAESAEAEEAAPQEDTDDNARDEADDPLAPEIGALLSMMNAPFSEIDIYRRYVSGLASFDTHQGVKGLEFERVMVIMDDSEARGFMFGYAKLLGEKEPTATDLKNMEQGKDTSIDRTRRLLYVTCSRAQHSLALVAYSENPAAIKAHAISNGWFSETEIDIE
ncbi:MAG: UvrD-helicase domain-containing protein [Hyphomicrobiales bacterium]